MATKKAASKSPKAVKINIFTGKRFRPAANGPLDPAGDFDTQSGTLLFNYVPTDPTSPYQIGDPPKKMKVSVTKGKDSTGRKTLTLNLVE